MRHAVLLVAVVLVRSATSWAQPPTEHCAVAVLTPPTGSALCPGNVASDPTRALDLSGGVGTGTFYLSLCGNGLVEYQLGVTVIDGPGADLQVEEVNPNIAEPYYVHVSPDGSAWFPAPGPYTAGTWAGDAAIDLAGLGTATVNFVRLTDASGVVAPSTPGPDFDAILANNYLPPLFGGIPRPYADTLISYHPGVTTSALLVDGTKALGRPDAHRHETWVGPGTTTFNGTWFNFVSLGQGAVLVVFFSTDYIIDGQGGDLLVHEYYSPEGNQFTVEASDDGVHWAPLTLVGSVSPTRGTGQPPTNNVQSFDLAGSGLLAADYVRLVSTATSGAGATPGAEIDALEAVNFAPKARRLAVTTPITAGGVGSITLTAPAHAGNFVITLPSGMPPVPAGSGLLLGSNMEYRLDLADPVLSFVLRDPLAALLVTGTIAAIPPAGSASVTVTLPYDPGLIGLALYWQSALVASVSPGLPTGVSNIALSRIQ